MEQSLKQTNNNQVRIRQVTYYFGAIIHEGNNIEKFTYLFEY